MQALPLSVGGPGQVTRLPECRPEGLGGLDHDVHGHPPADEKAADGRRLAARRDPFRQIHDDEQVEVASLPLLPSGRRAEEVDRLRVEGLDDAVPHPSMRFWSMAVS